MRNDQGEDSALDYASRKTKRDTVFIAVFVVVALASGWVGVLVDMLLPEQAGDGTLGMGIWLVLPFLCGLVIRALRGDWADFGLRPRLRGNMIWYALAILVFPAVTLLFVAVGRLFGVVSFSPGPVSSVVSLRQTDKLFHAMEVPNERQIRS